jgi:hypothetical protein
MNGYLQQAPPQYFLAGENQFASSDCAPHHLLQQQKVPSPCTQAAQTGTQ